MAQSSIFNGPRSYTVGTSSYNLDSVAVADFNGDGLPDMAVANNISNDVSVLLQNADGTFQPAVSYPVGKQPFSVQAGDVDGDGKADLVLSNTLDNTIGFLRGNGDGTFQTQLTTALPVTASPGFFHPFLLLGDWNGDGKTDIALAGALAQVGTYGIAILLSNGDGTFQTPVIYSLTAAPFTLNSADFNGDGKLDLVTEEGINGIFVRLGNGDGTFKAAINTSVSSVLWEPLLLIADFNQDGHLDIATALLGTSAHEGVPNLTVFLGDGNGAFRPNISSQQYAPDAVGDLNGDDKPDLLASGPGVVIPLLNTGNATFSPGPSSEAAQPMTLFDLDGDQKLDLITNALGFNGPTLVSVLHGNGDSTFAQFPVYGGSTFQLVAADFNNDGKPDLATTFIDSGSSLNIRLLFNDGAGFLPPIDTAIGSVSSYLPTYIAAGDFNHDGRMDLALASGDNASNSGIFVLLNKGNGTFQTAVQYGAQVFGPLSVADFNGDGNPDMIGLSFGSLSVLLGNSDGTFGFPVNTAVAAGSISAFVVGDFNRDGKLDLATLLQSKVVIFFGNGDGTFSVGPTYDAGTAPVSITMGELNGDGNLDLIVRNLWIYTPAEVVVLLGNGDGTFQSPIGINTDDDGFSLVTVGDFNLDGKADLALVNAYNQGVSLLLGNGDGTFQAPTKFFVSTTSSFDTGGLGLVVADFDGNGAPDLAVSGGVAGASILLNAAGSSAPTALLSTTILAFGNTTVGQASSPQTVTLTYPGATAMTIASIAISGAQSADFSQTNTCGTGLAAGASCTITVTFAPQATGGRSATIQITGNAANSPQVISVSGTGAAAPTIGLVVPSGGSSSATVTAGQAASYTMSIGGTGMSGSAALTCTGAPQGATCSVPSAVTVSGTTASTVNVSVATTSRTMALANSRGMIRFGGMWAAVMLGVVLVPMGRGRRNTRGLYLSAIFASLLLISSCGGGSSAATTNPKGTPAGTYSITVTATLNSSTESVKLQLIVQ